MNDKCPYSIPDGIPEDSNLFVRGVESENPVYATQIDGWPNCKVALYYYFQAADGDESEKYRRERTRSIHWRPYDEQSNIIAERAYQLWKESKINPHTLNHSYDLDFSVWHQVRKDNIRRTRPIQRIVYMWCWQDGTTWKPYDLDCSKIIEKAFVAESNEVIINIKNSSYIIDLIQKCQYRRDNHFLRRKIIRFGPDICPDFRKVAGIPPPTLPANFISQETKVDVTHTLKDEMTKLMNRTIFSEGHGDKFGTVGGKDPTRYEIVRVIKLQDPEKWRSYDVKRSAIRELLRNNNKFRNEYLHKSEHKMLSDPLDPIANEYYLFHGTDNHTIEKIVENGFDERFGSINGMFGPGIYFAEHSSKANQYVACPKCGGGSIPRKGKKCYCLGDIEYSMLIARVCLGNPYICLNYALWDGTKDTRQNRDEKNFCPLPSTGCHLNDDKQEHHSVYVEQQEAGGWLRAREFVVYDHKQTYPEYIIYYKRHADT